MQFITGIFALFNIIKNYNFTDEINATIYNKVWYEYCIVTVEEGSARHTFERTNHGVSVTCTHKRTYEVVGRSYHWGYSPVVAMANSIDTINTERYTYNGQVSVGTRLTEAKVYYTPSTRTASGDSYYHMPSEVDMEDSMHIRAEKGEPGYITAASPHHAGRKEQGKARKAYAKARALKGMCA
jgi:hypothetical protein